MPRIFLLIICLLLPTASARATTAPAELKDLFFGEALYYAFQDEWFAAISRLDTELRQYQVLDEPELDSLFSHVDQAQFQVGDFELAYRMHHKAGRAIKRVIEGHVAEEVRNEAIYRLARIYFQKEQPVTAHQVVERISGEVPDSLDDDLPFLRAQIAMANGRFSEVSPILRGLLGSEELAGFSSYNLGIAMLRAGKEEEGRRYLDRTGLLKGKGPADVAIRDKANLVLADKLMTDEEYGQANLVFDRVRLSGPFSNRALLGSGWAAASEDRYERALVPWTILAKRDVTDSAVQEALLAVPYAYGKLKVYSRAALGYGYALKVFSAQIERLDASIVSIREGKFLEALVREELQQDANWVVRLRELPDSPETYYLLDLLASHAFQESLKNYLDLEELRKKVTSWQEDLAALEDIIGQREVYYTPLLPKIDGKFRRLNSKMRLRLEQRDRIAKRLNNMLVVPRPDYLATAEERIAAASLTSLEAGADQGDSEAAVAYRQRLATLRGILHWNIYTQYDQRFTEAHKNLKDLNSVIEDTQKQYTSFVRGRQAATHSFQGYDEDLQRQNIRVKAGLERLEELMNRQGYMLEVMAVNELTGRRDRLEEYLVKARFAMADSYDRATRDQEKRDQEAGKAEQDEGAGQPEETKAAEESEEAGQPEESKPAEESEEAGQPEESKPAGQSEETGQPEEFKPTEQSEQVEGTEEPESTEASESLEPSEQMDKGAEQ